MFSIKLLLVTLVGHQLVLQAKAEDDKGKGAVWPVVLDSVFPIIGILSSIASSCIIQCSPNFDREILRKIMRIVSIGNWIAAWMAGIFFALSKANIDPYIIDDAGISDNVYFLLLALAWVIMMIESYVCRERWYIKHMADENFVLERIDQMRNAQPSITFKAVGYDIKSHDANICSRALTCKTPIIKTHDSKVSFQSNSLTSEVHINVIYCIWLFYLSWNSCEINSCRADFLMSQVRSSCETETAHEDLCES